MTYKLKPRHTGIEWGPNPTQLVSLQEGGHVKTQETQGEHHVKMKPEIGVM